MNYGITTTGANVETSSLTPKQYLIKRLYENSVISFEDMLLLLDVETSDSIHLYSDGELDIPSFKTTYSS